MFKDFDYFEHSVTFRGEGVAFKRWCGGFFNVNEVLELRCADQDCFYFVIAGRVAITDCEEEIYLC